MNKMKKMNKIYEAPKAEMIEMVMPVVLEVSSTGTNENPAPVDPNEE